MKTKRLSQPVYMSRDHDAAKATGIDVSEVVDLQASELACAVADAWTTVRKLCAVFPGMSPLITATGVIPASLVAAIDRLEAATRGSALRKVRP